MGWSSDVFNRLYSWVADKNSGTKIRADRMDAEFDNFKAGLEACLLRNGANKPSANIDWNAVRITNLADGVDEQDAVTLKQAVSLSPGHNFLDNAGFEMQLTGIGRPSTTAAAAGSYFCDRWYGWRGNAAAGATIAELTSATLGGFPRLAKLQRNAGNTSTEPLAAGQNVGIEDSILLQETQLSSGTFGLVASVYFKKGADFSGANASLLIRRLKGAPGVPVSNGTTVASVDIPAASLNTGAGEWVRAEVVFRDVSSNLNTSEYGLAVTYTPTGTAGAEDALYFTGAKLEMNDTGVASEYTVPPLAHTVERCARFYQVFGGAQYAIRRTGYSSASAEDWLSLTFPKMNQTPGITKNGTWVVGNCSQPIAFATATTFSLYTTVTALGAFGYYTNASDHTVVLEAEKQP